MKKWLKRYPMGAGRLANMDSPTFSILEVGDDQRKEEMTKKLSQCWQASGDGPYSLVYFRTGRREVGDEPNSEELVKKLSQCW